MKKLFIAEKPYTAKAILDHLWPDGDYEKGRNYWRKGDITVTCAAGHVLGLALPKEYDARFESWSEYGIYPDKWKIIPLAGKENIVRTVKELLKDADVVVHAGDPDREGQLIVDELLNYCGYKGKVQRLEFPSIDDVSVSRGFEKIDDNSNSIHLNMSQAGLGRERADWLVGMNLSRAYTVNARRFGYESTFRIGRVKIPTLALVVNREKEIKNFKPVKYYVLDGTFSKDNINFKAAFIPGDKLQTDSEDRVLDKNVLMAIQAKLAHADAHVDKVEAKEGVENPPLPYSLDALQVEANKLYGYSPKLVLDTVQSLYEKKYVSYPRSDCNYIPASQHDDVIKILPMLSELNIPGTSDADTSLVSKAWNDKKISAHHAIIPTGVKPSSLNKDEDKIYSLIAARYVLQFHKPCTYRTVSFVLKVADELFKGTGTTILEPGFRKIVHVAKTADDQNNTVLPLLSVNDLVKTEKLGVLDKVTKPPKRFSMGSLLAAMTNIWKFMSKDNPNREKLKEVKGIGTSATRDAIIDELLNTKVKGHEATPCMKLVKNDLVPTQFGISLIDIVDESLTKPDLTAEMEYALTEIADGKKSLNDYMVSVKNMVLKNIHYAENTKFKFAVDTDIVLCPVCKKSPLRRYFSPKNKSHFWLCTDDSCVSPVTGKKLYYSDLDNKPVIVGCPDDGYPLRRIKGKNGFFWACDQCKKTFSDKAGKPELVKKVIKKG